LQTCRNLIAEVGQSSSANAFFHGLHPLEPFRVPPARSLKGQHSPLRGAWGTGSSAPIPDLPALATEWEVRPDIVEKVRSTIKEETLIHAVV
jgi:hypothetical protein